MSAPPLPALVFSAFITGTGTECTSPSLSLSVLKRARYSGDVAPLHQVMFNCGECATRILSESAVKPSKLALLCTTSMHPANVSGLPGLLFHLSDRGAPALELIGPPLMPQYASAVSIFVTRAYPVVTTTVVDDSGPVIRRFSWPGVPGSKLEIAALPTNGFAPGVAGDKRKRGPVEHIAGVRNTGDERPARILYAALLTVCTNANVAPRVTKVSSGERPLRSQRDKGCDASRGSIPGSSSSESSSGSQSSDSDTSEEDGSTDAGAASAQDPSSVATSAASVYVARVAVLVVDCLDADDLRRSAIACGAAIRSFLSADSGAAQLDAAHIFHVGPGPAIHSAIYAAALLPRGEVHGAWGLGCAASVSHHLVSDPSYDPALRCGAPQSTTVDAPSSARGALHTHFPVAMQQAVRLHTADPSSFPLPASLLSLGEVAAVPDRVGSVGHLPPVSSCGPVHPLETLSLWPRGTPSDASYGSAPLAESDDVDIEHAPRVYTRETLHRIATDARARISEVDRCDDVAVPSADRETGHSALPLHMPPSETVEGTPGLLAPSQLAVEDNAAVAKALRLSLRGGIVKHDKNGGAAVAPPSRSVLPARGSTEGTAPRPQPPPRPTHLLASHPHAPQAEGAAQHAAHGASDPAPCADRGTPVCAPAPPVASPSIAFLGTGAAAPSKLRSCSGLWLRLPSGGTVHEAACPMAQRTAASSSDLAAQTEGDSLMLDCGEGCVTRLSLLLQSLAGHSKTDATGGGLGAMLRGLRLLWISHLHADHHSGLISLLWRRAQQQLSVGPSIPPLLIVGPPALGSLIAAYSMLICAQVQPSVDQFAAGCIAHFQPASDAAWLDVPHEEGRSASCACRAQLPIAVLRSVRVDHCRDAFGVVVVIPCFAPTEPGAATVVVYSGDTRPCDRLVGAAADGVATAFRRLALLETAARAFPGSCPPHSLQHTTFPFPFAPPAQSRASHASSAALAPHSWGTTGLPSLVPHAPWLAAGGGAFGYAVPAPLLPGGGFGGFWMPPFPGSDRSVFPMMPPFPGSAGSFFPMMLPPMQPAGLGLSYPRPVYPPTAGFPRHTSPDIALPSGSGHYGYNSASPGDAGCGAPAVPSTQGDTLNSCDSLSAPSVPPASLRVESLVRPVASPVTLLLIHEATMNDDRAEDARKKRHCTVAEALSIAGRMSDEVRHAGGTFAGAILTHFSQRYPSLPSSRQSVADPLKTGDASEIMTQAAGGSLGQAAALRYVCAFDGLVAPLFRAPLVAWSESFPRLSDTTLAVTSKAAE